MRPGWQRFALLFSLVWGVFALFTLASYIRHARLQSDPDVARRFEVLVAEFLKLAKPEAALEFANSLGARQAWVASKELLDPATALPLAYRYDRNALAELWKAENNCLGLEPGKPTAGGTVKSDPRTSEDPALRKYAEWVRFVCGKSEALDAGFFRSPPFAFPLGGSWVKHAYENGRGPWEAKDARWQELTRHLHFLELGEAPAKGNIPPAPLLALGAENLARLLAGDRLVLTDKYVFLRHEGGAFRAGGEPGPGLSAFAVGDWEWYFRDKPLKLAPAGASCAVEISGLCLQADARAERRRDSRSLAVFGITIALLLAWIAALALQKLQIAQNARAERELMIQTLAHELRHPAASIQLSLEAFRREFDSLPGAAQDEFLRMADQVQRLSRVIHASRQYLQSSERTGKAFQFQFVDVESFHELVREATAPYSEKIELQLAPPDVGVRLDPYWTALCVTNLIKNALIHGKPPIRVQAFANREDFCVEVADAGATELPFAEMVTAFRKRPGSPGMGLGLSLVDRLAGLMGGKLEYAAAPTLFRIRLPRKGQE